MFFVRLITTVIKFQVQFISYHMAEATKFDSKISRSFVMYEV